MLAKIVRLITVVVLALATAGCVPVFIDQNGKKRVGLPIPGLPTIPLGGSDSAQTVTPPVPEEMASVEFFLSEPGSIYYGFTESQHPIGQPNIRHWHWILQPGERNFYFHSNGCLSQAIEGVKLRKGKNEILRVKFQGCGTSATPAATVPAPSPAPAASTRRTDPIPTPTAAPPPPAPMTATSVPITEIPQAVAGRKYRGILDRHKSVKAVFYLREAFSEEGNVTVPTLLIGAITSQLTNSTYLRQDRIGKVPTADDLGDYVGRAVEFTVNEYGGEISNRANVAERYPYVKSFVMTLDP